MAKTKLTPKVIKDIDKYLKEGNYEITACQLVNISQTTYYNWKNQATEIVEKLEDEELQKEELTIFQKRLIKFLDTINKAKAYAEEQAVKNIQRAGLDPKHWQANAWYLERKYPNRWAKKEPGLDGGNDDSLDRFLDETERVAEEALEGDDPTDQDGYPQDPPEETDPTPEPEDDTP